MHFIITIIDNFVGHIKLLTLWSKYTAVLRVQILRLFYFYLLLPSTQFLENGRAETNFVDTRNEFNKRCPSILLNEEWKEHFEFISNWSDYLGVGQTPEPEIWSFIFGVLTFVKILI